MPITIQKQITKWRDLDPSLALNPRTGDVSAKTGLQAIEQHLKYLLTFMAWDVPFHPEIDSGIAQLPFDLESDALEAIAAALISNCIRQFEPRIDVSDPSAITAVWSDQDQGLKVTIVGRVLESAEPITFTTILKRLR